MTKDRPKFVVVGGGSGISNILRGLKQYETDLTAIVTMFDNGGSSGLLQTEFGYPPFGDLRQCLLALGNDNPGTEGIRDALDYRFGSETSLGGHTVGNLLLAALTSLNEGLENAIHEVGQVLNVVGSVVPVTLEGAELCAELGDGQVITGESNIDTRKDVLPPIQRVFLDHPVSANPKAISAIEEADAIVLGPGDLYTSILPNLLADGIVDAIASSEAQKLYVCNLMTKRGETDGFAASDFAREISRHLGYGTLDWTLVNTDAPPEIVQQAYAEEGANLVAPDIGEVRKHSRDAVGAPLASIELPLRHDPDRTAAALVEIWERFTPTNGQTSNAIEPASQDGKGAERRASLLEELVVRDAPTDNRQ